MVTAVSAFPVSGKKKSFDICLAFARGCGGSIATTLKLQDGPAAFYGVDDSNVEIWRAVRADGRDFYYIDNSFYDSARQEQFRIAKNRMQHTGVGTSDGARFKALDIEIKPWRASGEHIVVCPQSMPFMRVCGYEGDWLEKTIAELNAVTDRPLRVRNWSANKSALAATLGEDLRGAHALVTWSSAAAVTAILSGVPAIVGSDDCAAKPMAGTMAEIENLPMREREEWAGVLADSQWSMDEIKRGVAWKALSKQ